MDTIHKYAVPLTDISDIRMPAGARVICVGVQDGHPFIWARVDSKAPTVERRFRLASTGHDLAMGPGAPYLGTVMLHGGALVFHLFDLGEIATKAGG